MLCIYTLLQNGLQLVTKHHNLRFLRKLIDRAGVKQGYHASLVIVIGELQLHERQTPGSYPAARFLQWT